MSTTTEPRTVTLTIPGTPAYSLSPNGGRKHWSVRYQETETVKGFVAWAIAEKFCGFPDQFRGPVRLHWTVYLDKGRKRLDNDNMLACLKAHQDGIVYRGVIPDDSPKWIPETPTVEQIAWGQHKGEPRIVVTITDAATGGQDG